MRLGRADCEIGFGPLPAPADNMTDLLLRDFVLPVGSPRNVARIAALPAAHRLEGFPLLHLDFYRDDPAGLSWPDWIARNGIARTAPDRGMRFQRLTAALAAVEADAGLVLAGIGLILDQIDSGRIELPYPSESGTWSGHAFIARYRPDTGGRRPIAMFRAWLAKECGETRERLAAMVGGDGRD